MSSKLKRIRSLNLLEGWNQYSQRSIGASFLYILYEFIMLNLNPNPLTSQRNVWRFCEDQIQRRATGIATGNQAA